MPDPTRKLIVGNWKMNGLRADLEEVRALIAALDDAPSAARLALCPPATLLHGAAAVAHGSAVEIGAQDVSTQMCGAHTGDLAAEMLRDSGARLVIVGHSERRADHAESNAVVADKVRAVLRAGLEPIVCVGELESERDAGRAEAVVRAQVSASLPAELDGHAFAIAYEPVWAIGSGKTPTLEQVSGMHAVIRDVLGARPSPILYGGSVKPSNAHELLHAPGVDGALVGGASLKADDFLAIIRAAE